MGAIPIHYHLFSARTAPNRSTGLPDDRKSCRTVTAGVSSRVDTSRMEQIARAASKMTCSEGHGA